MGVSGERILLSTWTEWSSDTSVAGASNAGRANKSLPAKMIWMAIFVAGLVFTVLSLKSVIDTYLKYEVETTYKVEKYSRFGINFNFFFWKKCKCNGFLQALFSCRHHMQPEQDQLQSTEDQPRRKT